MYLPYLHPDWIPDAFQRIRTEIESEFSATTEEGIRWNKFNDGYINEYWILKVKPKNFNVFELPDRTNNYLESYHKSMNRHFQGKNGFKEFISMYDLYLKIIIANLNMYFFIVNYW